MAWTRSVHSCCIGNVSTKLLPTLTSANTDRKTDLGRIETPNAQSTRRVEIFGNDFPSDISAARGQLISPRRQRICLRKMKRSGKSQRMRLKRTLKIVSKRPIKDKDSSWVGQYVAQESCSCSRQCCLPPARSRDYSGTEGDPLPVCPLQ